LPFPDGGRLTEPIAIILALAMPNDANLQDGHAGAQGRLHRFGDKP
jgi:hypothetical protein